MYIMRKVIIRSQFILLVLGIALCLFMLVQVTLGSNIDPTDKYAWSTGAGWINFNPQCDGCEGVTVYRDHLEGYAWSESAGWIRMGTHTGGRVHTYANTSQDNYGVNIDGAGNLSGYAWSTSAGWINFAPTDGGVMVDLSTGAFDGYAWSESVGWIHVKSTGVVTYGVVAVADVSLTKAVTPTQALPGDRITYTLAFSNPGIMTATHVVLTDTVPVSVTVSGVISAGVIITPRIGTHYVWDIADLVPGGGGTLTITGVLSKPLAAGTFTNTATITTTAVDADVGNNTATAAVQIPPPPVLQSFSPDRNAHAVSFIPAISATYDLLMDPATVTSRTFAIHGMQLGQRLQTYSVDGRVVSLTPTQPLKPGELVQVSATTGTLSMSGRGPISPTVWQFRAAVGGGSGTLDPPLTTPGFGAGSSFGVELGDLDGDGDLDAFVAQVNLTATVWLNDGWGRFTAHPSAPNVGYASDVALGDIDGDGDLDAVVACYNQAQTVWVNDGTGAFTAHPTAATFGGANASRGVTLGDIDGDGDLDAVIANQNGAAETVWLNDGKGAFTAHTTTSSFGADDSQALALGDIDSDGDLDALVANTNAQNETVWINDGVGNFLPHPSVPTFNGGQDSTHIVLSDLDGDGDLDAWITNYDSVPRANTVWFNDGAGAFSDSGQALGDSNSRQAAMGDLDGDGDLDVLVANTYGEANTVWENDGAGYFTPNSGTFGFGASDSNALALGDLDGDRDLDGLVANDNGQTQTVWFNRNTVTLTGPTELWIAEFHAFTATVSPLGAQTPMTYVWHTGERVITHTDGTSDTAVISWTTAGTYVITVTVTNAASSVSTTHAITISAPPLVCTDVTSVAMHLVTLGALYTDTLVTLRVDIAPDNAGKPYTYTVDYGDGMLISTETSNDDPLMLTHTFVATGTYPVEIAVWNCDLTTPVTDTEIVRVHEHSALPVSVDGVSLAGSRDGVIGEVYAFTATVSPITATTPITYQWRMTNSTGRMITHTDGLQDTAVVSWTTAGPQVITVTATNAMGRVSATHTITLSAPVQAEWRWLAGGETLNAVSFVDTHHGCAVGSNGTVLCTQDGGVRWNPQQSNADTALSGVQFVDAQHGWAVGDDGGIITTQDGGDTWQTQMSSTTHDLKAVTFVDTQRGWAVGYNGTILNTLDGGRTWITQESTITDDLYGVYFLDEQKGWVVGSQGTTLKTTDGGSTWTFHSSETTESLRDVVFADALNGWIVSYDGSVLVTTDGGETWSQQAEGFTWYLYGVDFSDADHGWAVGRDWGENKGLILTTSNGGIEWQEQFFPVGHALNDVEPIDAKSAWIVGEGMTVLTTDSGGEQWYAQTTSPDERLEGVAFVNAAQGWAVSYEGSILASADGGLTWSVQDEGFSWRLYDLYVVDDYHGWAVGKDWGAGRGLILHTSDGGATGWYTQAVNTTNEFYSVYFLDTQRGWTVGAAGTVRVTTDGGVTWEARNSGTTEDLKRVFFVDTDHGWAVGHNGAIIASTDGGETWTSQTSHTTRYLEDVYFVDAQQGWVVGNTGTLLVTSNGGATWSAQASPSSQYLKAMYFWDRQRGWAVGANGVILSTSDGSKTWGQVPALSYADLYALAFVNEDRGWAVGQDGTVLGYGETVATPHVILSGPTSGRIDTVYPFTATVIPASVSTPLTYAWQATDQSPVVYGDGLLTTLPISWTTSGLKHITVTVQTPDGLISDASSIDIRGPVTCPYPLNGVRISGPTAGYTNTRYTFTSQLMPTDATQPVTLTWMPAPLSGQGTQTVAYRWATPGPYSLTLRAENCGGSLSATHSITVSAPPPSCPRPLGDVIITGPTDGYTDTRHMFTGSLVPPDATQPVTLTWKPAPLHGQGTMTATYQWPSPGTYPFTLTAKNCGGIGIATHAIAISPPTSQGDYEPNDTCTQAKFIATNGLPQVHTFHDEGDEDWVAFQATAGITYVVEARVPPTSNVDLMLELYETCIPGAPSFDDENPPFNPDIRFSFMAPTSGVYYLRLFSDVATTYGPNVVYHLSVQALHHIKPADAVILVAGRYRADDPLQQNIYNTTDALCAYALDQGGCRQEQITYLAAEARPGSTGVATKVALQSAVTQWAVERLGPGQALTLYLFDHGRVDGFYLDGVTGELLSPLELDGWLDQLEAAVPGVEINVIIEACHSGSFIEPPKSLSGTGRVVIASTAPLAVAYASKTGAVFSDAFLNALRQTPNLWTAFDEGTWGVRQGHPDQTPWLDDTGNGQPNEPFQDGQLATQRAFACVVNVPQENWPPHITDAAFTHSVGNQVQLWAVAKDDEDVSGLWSLIYPPSWQRPRSGEEMVADPNPVILPQNQDNFGGDYVLQNGVEFGMYRVVFHAQDNRNLVARPFQVKACIGDACVEPGTSQMVQIPIGDLTTTVEIPAGAVTATTAFTYTGFTDSPFAEGLLTEAPASTFAGRSFALTAYQYGDPQPGFTFMRSITITVHYSDADVAELDEGTLALYYRDGDIWSQDGLSRVAHLTATNELVVTAEHLSTFALFGQAVSVSTPRVYLPLVLRQ